MFDGPFDGGYKIAPEPVMIRVDSGRPRDDHHVGVRALGKEAAAQNKLAVQGSQPPLGAVAPYGAAHLFAGGEAEAVHALVFKRVDHERRSDARLAALIKTVKIRVFL